MWPVVYGMCAYFGDDGCEEQEDHDLVAPLHNIEEDSHESVV